jgi:hypothetical protein
LEAHVVFVKKFETALGQKSFLRTKAPMPVALLIAEKMSMNFGSDFNDIIASVAREFGI